MTGQNLGTNLRANFMNTQTKQAKHTLKHTRAPWKFDTDNKGTYVVISDYGVVHISDGVGQSEQREANARLIASAPELLEALQDCVESLSRLDDKDDAYRVACLKQAREAIAKAGGQ